MDNIDKTPVTPEIVWAALKETDKLLKESIAASDKRSAETDRQIRELNDKFNGISAHDMEEMKKYSAETGRQIRELNDKFNGISKSNGLFAEEYFFNSFNEGNRTFLGETYDSIKKNLKGTESNDEYDIVFINGKSVCIVEIKYRARLDDIPKIISKANTFRINFPNYHNHRVYFAMASMMFNQRIEDECKNEGIAVIKQSGDTVTFIYDNLKAF